MELYTLDIHPLEGSYPAATGQRFGAGFWWSPEPGMDRVAHGVANWVDRLYAIGNGHVQEVARLLAWKKLNS